ncbi:MBL fold metallo-hydrolase, partial [Bacillus anthracis]|nr:MBL fold metallo-hydrolase [Bacillus anthracis]
MLFSLLYRMYTLNVNLKEMYVDDLIYSTFIKRYGG